jgi:hypothetical protein
MPLKRMEAAGYRKSDTNVLVSCYVGLGLAPCEYTEVRSDEGCVFTVETWVSSEPNFLEQLPWLFSKKKQLPRSKKRNSLVLKRNSILA